MITIDVHDGHYHIVLPKCLLILTKTEFITALRRAKAWKRQQTLTRRLAEATATTPTRRTMHGRQKSH